MEQDNYNFEWLVVDGGSGDVVEDWLRECKEVSPFAMKWTSEPDDGIYDAMSKGVRMSSGSHVIFLNAGDLFAGREVISHLYSAISATALSHYCVICGAYYLKIGSRKFLRFPKSGKYIRNGLPTSHQAMLYTRDLCEEIGFLPWMKVSGDYYMTAQAYAQGATFVAIKNAVAIFEFGGTSTRHRDVGLSEVRWTQKNILGMGRFEVKARELRRDALFFGKRLINVMGSMRVKQDSAERPTA